MIHADPLYLNILIIRILQIFHNAPRVDFNLKT